MDSRPAYSTPLHRLTQGLTAGRTLATGQPTMLRCTYILLIPNEPTGKTPERCARRCTMNDNRGNASFRFCSKTSKRSPDPSTQSLRNNHSMSYIVTPPCVIESVKSMNHERDDEADRRRLACERRSAHASPPCTPREANVPCTRAHADSKMYAEHLCLIESKAQCGLRILLARARETSPRVKMCE